jgi:hypothetical protein
MSGPGVTKEAAMKKNMGAADRFVRSLIAIVILALYFSGQISGTVAIVLGIVAAAFLITSFVGSCPAYVPFGLSTCKRDSES